MASPDTSDDAARVQREALRRLGGPGRVALAFRMSREAWEVAIDGIQSRRPELGREEARHLLLRRTLGDELYEAAYGSRRAGRA